MGDNKTVKGFLESYKQDPLWGKHLSSYEAHANCGPVDIVSAATPVSQLQGLAQELQRLHQGSDFDPTKATIALADTTLLIPLLYALGNYPLNIDMAYPFYHTPLYALIKDVITWYYNAHDAAREDATAIASELVKLCSHAYIKPTEVIIAQLQAVCTQDVQQVSIQDLPALWDYLFKGLTEAKHVLDYLHTWLDLLHQKQSASWAFWEVAALQTAKTWCQQVTHTIDIPDVIHDKWLHFLLI